MPGAIKDLYRTIAGAIASFSVGIQYWLVVLDGGATLRGSVHFFSYFTILTNILVAVALLVPVVAPASRAGHFLDRPPVRTAIAGYIIVVGAVYYLLLRNTGHAQGWTLFFEHVLHYVTPPLFVLDWLLFVPKGGVPWRTGFACLGFPAVYAVWTLAYGALSGWYPYPFLDVPDLGYAQALLNMAGLVTAFLILELVLVAIGRLLARSASAR
ncbi:MAG TPA: Pr6Pr family membrane protein [Hyphomicrobium sp.]|jgi:hypothetical protein